jgi:hypothetical protein
VFAEALSINVGLVSVEEAMKVPLEAVRVLIKVVRVPIEVVGVAKEAVRVQHFHSREKVLVNCLFQLTSQESACRLQRP